MKSSPIQIQPAPPDLPGLTWRPVDVDDLPALVDLAQACLQADGGLGFLFDPPVIRERFFPAAPGRVLGGFDARRRLPAARRLAACAAVTHDAEAGSPRLTLLGHVRPDLRRKGIGGYLMRWSQAQAAGLLADTPGIQATLRVATETLTDPAERLYLAHGFEKTFEELVMARSLRQPLPEQPFPPGVSVSSWSLDLAGQFYKAYYPAFRDRPGFPGYTAEQWIGRITDDDLVPEWTLLAQEGGEPVGFIIGDIDLTAEPRNGYIQQVGVVPAQRRRGLASALLVETMRRMQAAEAASALLAVHTNNPGAIKAYAALGFVTIGRRARYERTA